MRKICYSKLWKLLIDKRMNGSELRKAVEMAPNTLTKLYKEEPVSMETLLRICEYLDCDIGDIVEFLRTGDNAATDKEKGVRQNGLDKIEEKRFIACRNCRDLLSYCLRTAKGRRMYFRLDRQKNVDAIDPICLFRDPGVLDGVRYQSHFRQKHSVRNYRGDSADGDDPFCQTSQISRFL